jgi:hypothetical protein
MSHNAGSEEWWLTVQSMPHVEAVSLLNDYRFRLVDENNCTATHIAAAKTLVKVNSEIKRINTIMANASWNNACKNVLTPELYLLVFEEKKRLETFFEKSK